MAELNAKQFIQTVFIDELGCLVDSKPYHSFMLMSIGIEFLGKCIDKNLVHWNERASLKYFKNAISKIPSLKKYECYLKSYNFYNSFRSGLVHAGAPTFSITLSSKNQTEHLVIQNERLNLKVEDFYADFKMACEFVINENYSNDNKMVNSFLKIPD